MTRIVLAVAIVASGISAQDSGGLKPSGYVSADRLREHLETLASDAFEGRAPGTHGGALTVDYITRELKSYGLKGANPDGSFEQAVPLVSWRIRGSATLVTAQRARTLASTRDFLVLPAAPPLVGDTDIPAVPLVLAESADIDVRGKIAVVLPGATPRASTIAAAKTRGAVGVLIVFEPTATAPTIDRSIGPNAREIGVAPPPGGLPAGDRFFAALISRDVFDDISAATSKNQTPTMSVHLTRVDRSYTSPNLVAVLRGSDPARRDEVIVYTGHWDHLGRDDRRSGDQIFNGAVDNAGGIAQLLEIARAFSRRAPKRTVLFIATTAEEDGLIGANYYVQHPIFPLNKTVADINLDGFWPLGPLPDLVEFGAGNTSFDDLVQQTSAALHRRVVPDPMPAEHFYQRSDQWPFALAGIPGIFPSGWPTPHPEDPTWRDEVQAYLTTDYHKVTDEYHATWDLVGAVGDAEWMLEFGWRLAQSTEWAKWKANAPCQPCKAKGDAIVR